MELVINFSGGKDSVVMLDMLVKRFPNVKKHVVFADTGWEHVGAEDWCRLIAMSYGLELVVVRNSKKDFWGMVKGRRKFPSPKYRQCTSDLKRGPIQTWIRNNCGAVVMNCMGLRAAESTSRAKRMHLQRNSKLTNRKRTVWDWLPIKHMTDDEVYGYIKTNNLPLHPVYGWLRRFSCRVCIYMTERDLCAVAKNDPEAIEMVASAEIETGFTMKPEGGIKEIIGKKYEPA